MEKPLKDAEVDVPLRDIAHEPKVSVELAAVLLQLGATDDEVGRAWQVMRFWAVPDTPTAVIDDCRRALAKVREPCGDAWEDYDSFGIGHDNLVAD